MHPTPSKNSSRALPSPSGSAAGGQGAHILLVEDEADARQVLGTVLEQGGYRVSSAENGRQALQSLFEGCRPDLIVLDLKMPVMDGWEFRKLQRSEALLGLIPVLAISGDVSPQAQAISAHAYLRKPFDAAQLLSTLGRVLLESQRDEVARANPSERLSALGRLAAGLGHQINNPLTTVMMNLGHALERLQALTLAVAEPPFAALGEVDALEAIVLEVSDGLRECQAGSRRIRDIVSMTQRLAYGEHSRARLDVNALVLQSVARLCEGALPRPRLTHNLGRVPAIRGDAEALTQVFLNLLLNAAESIVEADAERHEIRVSTWVQYGEPGGEVVIEIADAGEGIPHDIAPHLFEPFFTTKLLQRSIGLGLTTSHHTILSHHGRITFESEVGKGSAFRVILPSAAPSLPPRT